MNAEIAVARTEPRPNKALHVSLWVVQGLLAFAFLMAGGMKLAQPFAEMVKNAPAMAQLGEPLVRFIGISEVLGALGLILPSVTRIKPGLTALAGAALGLVMVLAAGYHVMHGEFSHLPVVAVLFGLAAFVAWGRFRKAPIAARAQK